MIFFPSLNCKSLVIELTHLLNIFNIDSQMCNPECRFPLYYKKHDSTCQNNRNRICQYHRQITDQDTVYPTMPVQNKVNIRGERSWVDFVRQVLIACGKNAVVVRIAEMNPIVCIEWFIPKDIFTQI